MGPNAKQRARIDTRPLSLQLHHLTPPFSIEAKLHQPSYRAMWAAYYGIIAKVGVTPPPVANHLVIDYTGNN